MAVFYGQCNNMRSQFHAHTDHVCGPFIHLDHSVQTLPCPTCSYCVETRSARKILPTVYNPVQYMDLCTYCTCPMARLIMAQAVLPAPGSPHVSPGIEQALFIDRTHCIYIRHLENFSRNKFSYRRQTFLCHIWMPFFGMSDVHAVCRRPRTQ